MTVINRYLFYLILTVFLAIYSVQAQNGVYLNTLTTASGLNFRHVNAIAQDKQGFMWFGTSQGLIKHDGYTFINFTSNKENPNFIPFDLVRKLQYQQSTNTLWYIANQKLFALNLETDRLNQINDPDNLLHDEVIEIRLDKTDNLWIVTDQNTHKDLKTQHLIKFNGQNFKFIKSLSRKSAGFSSIDITQNNEVSWSTVSNESYLFNQEGKIKKNAFLETYTWYGKTLHYGISFFDSENQHYYLAQGKGGVDIYKDFKYNHTLLTSKEKFFFAAEDDSKGMWFAGKKQLVHVDSTKVVTNYSQQINEVLDFSHINTMFYDASSLLWLGTDNGLIKVKLKPQKFEKILYNGKASWGLSFREIFPLKNNEIGALCESQKMLYKIGASGQATPIPFKNSDVILKDARHFIADTLSQKAYTITNAFVEVDFKKQAFQVYPEFAPYLNETKSNPIIQLHDGKLLAGYKLSKLIYIDPATKAFTTAIAGVPSNDYELRTLLKSHLNKDLLWVGTESDGLLKLKRNAVNNTNYEVVASHKFNNNTITTLLEMNDLLFVGTFGGGVSILNTKTNAVQVLNKITGLPDNNIAAIKRASDKHVIIATFNGLSLYNLQTNKAFNYFTDDGLSHNEFNFVSAYQDLKGNFYLGGMNGINKFNHKNLVETYQLPGINFTKYSFYNQRKDTLIEQTKLSKIPLVLSPYDINFQVNWSIPDYYKNKSIRYFTQLSGFENQWTYQENTNFVKYNKLPAGSYTLRVKGLDVNGNLCNTELQIPFVVNEIFYKRWWFITLLIVFVLCLLYFFYNYRLQQALSIERLRTKISSDLHDDVGSMLTGLAMQTEMLEIQTENKIDKRKLHKITTLSRNTVAHMRDLVWSIDGRKDTVADLIDRMQELAEEMLLPANIRYDLHAQELNTNKKLHLDCKRNLFLIFKEAVHNIVKHSNATHVNIQISNTAAGFLLYIKDNGTSRQKLKNHTGMGLANMQLRCDNINANLAFDLENGFGVRVTLPYVI